MGNKLGRARQVVEDKYTMPQGLFQHKDVDHKKLRKLILDSKLAPCYPGDDECANSVLEECPICFLYYPSLNRSRCCMKGICTECFLQMKTPNSARPTQCPFCKTSNYAVEYRGVKTKEERGMEQIEEQRVIEAKIRMRQQELQTEEDRVLKHRDISSSRSIAGPREIEYCSAAAPTLASVVERAEVLTSQETSASPTIRQTQRMRHNREDEFDLDLEDIMVMEAIWLSIQENGRNRNMYSCVGPSEQYTSAHQCVPAMASVSGSSSPSPSCGLACAIATLAERQQTSGESGNYGGNMPLYSEHPVCARFTNREEQGTDDYPHAKSTMHVLPESQLTVIRDDEEWTDHGSVVAEAGTSYAHSDEMEDDVAATSFPSQGEIETGFQPTTSSIVPESFEEQMMLAMAVSLAEARTRTKPPGVAWH